MKKTVWTWVVCLLLVSLVSAAIPETVNIHGKLKNINGTDLEGTFAFNFSLYTTDSGGSNIYTQSQNLTTDVDGIYTTILTGLGGVDFEQDTWLEIQIESDSPMSPRIEISSVPSALAGAGGGAGGIVNGSLPWLYNESSTMFFNETHFNTTVPLLGYWTEGVSNDLYYDSGNVTIGGASSEGILGLVSALTETIYSIDNTGIFGDSVIKFQLGGTTLLTLGIRDAGANDPFEFNYADGLDSSPELTITTDDILIGTPTVGAASLIFNNKLENTCPFIGDVNVDDTNYLYLPVSTCTYDDFLNGIEGQLLVIICPRPHSVTITVADTPREIGLSGGNDFVCVNAGDTLTLFMGPPPFNEWFELSRSFNS